MKKYSVIEQKVIDAIGQWDSEDWIVSATQSIGGAIYFTVHMETKIIDCSEIEVQEIKVEGNWIIIFGWLK